MRKLLATMSLLAIASVALVSAAMADPGGPNLQQPIALSCTDGSHPVVNPGTLTNQARVAWDTNSNSVFVTASLAFTNGTETDVIFVSKQGLKNLITCTGDAGGGFTVVATGFFTPR